MTKILIPMLALVLILQQKCGVGDCKTIVIIDGKPIEVNIPCPVPSPSPSPSEEPIPSPSPTTGPVPSPSPSNLPSPSPTPIPSPSPSPKPSPSPSTTPSIPDYCIIGPDGNFGEPPLDLCPACWIDYAELKNQPIIEYWGIAFRSKRSCSGADCGCGVVTNVDITPHSDKPFLRHRAGGGSETHKGCQPAKLSPEVPDIWVYPPNDTPGLCDPFSGDRYWCHHKAKAGTCGPTKFEVRQDPFRSIIVNIP